MLDDLWTALALVLVFEGIFPFISPNGMRKTMLALSQMSDHQLRFIGVTSMLIGLGVLYFVT
jgi:uncharacterized protein YjeT (DUF2065 family)